MVTGKYTKEILGWADYAVIGIILAISSSIGVYFRFTGGRQKTVQEYFSADRTINAGVLAFALMVSYMSAITLLGTSAENYAYGSQIAALYLAQGLATPFVSYLYLPVFFKFQKMSTFEYLEMRFGFTARLLTSIMSASHMLLYTGIVLYAPALALEATTGFSTDLSILLIGIICTFYSTIGGIKAVLMTAVFQGIFMFGAAIIVIILGIINIEGGVGRIWQLAVDGGRIEFDNFSLDPTMRHTWWNLTIGTLILSLAANGVTQVQVQRFLTAKTLRSAQIAAIGSWPLALCLGLLASFAGLVMYAFFVDCDPVASGEISANDMLMPYFVVMTTANIPGLAGLFIAGIFSASLSTVSAIINALTAVALEDYVKPVYDKLGFQFPEKRAILFGKFLAVAVGVICILLSYLSKRFGSLVQATYSIAGIVYGPLLAIFTLGMFFESAEEKGAVTGTLFGLALVSWIAFGYPRPSNIPLSVSTVGCNNVTLPTQIVTSIRQMPLGDSSYFYLYRISYMWYAPMGFIVSMVIGLAVSNLIGLLSKNTPREIDPDLFTPLIAKRVRRRRVNVSKTSNIQISTIHEHKRDIRIPS
ncbi:putative sodium-dependent multivitamin transporter [Neodiprion fabricii]|uniref:putative sodium-dependent multivitamin transporter n=1 Tax=Neodiprion fabricii TaxID=2872261 RepID=UPI001ED8EBB1|nr:putative sodium-dependent multivitamin transporter [Neodiprion fabricii]